MFYIIIKDELPDKVSVGSKAQAQLLVHECAKKLQEHYPNHIWHVSMTDDHSIINVRCLNVHGNLGYTVYTQYAQNDPDLKCIVKAGGEILERAFISRGKNKGGYADRIDLQGVDNNRLRQNDTKHSIKVIK